MKKCLICKRKFAPNKYRSCQQVCSDKICQHKRQINNMRAWRQENPDYWNTPKNKNYQKEYRKCT